MGAGRLRYDCSVPEEFERLVADIARTHDVSGADVRSVIGHTPELRDHALLSRERTRNGLVHVPLGDIESGGGGASTSSLDARRQAIALEAERVVVAIERQLTTHLNEGSIRQYSNVIDNEFWFVATVGYHVAAGREVEEHVQSEFSHQRSIRDPRRPAYVCLHRFNVRQALRYSKKKWFMTNFVFLFTQDPCPAADDDSLDN
jgi:hypothetical protein